MVNKTSFKIRYSVTSMGGEIIMYIFLPGYDPSIMTTGETECAAVYINLNRHEFILFGTNLCHCGVNQYQSGMKSHHQTMESGVKNVSKKFSETLDVGM